MNYELGKVQEYRAEREAKRTSAGRSRTYSQSKPSKSSLGSDDAASNASILRRSWASKSTVEVSSHTPVPRDTRKSLRETLLAPLRTTFTRSNRSTAPKSIRDDSSSFFAGSSIDLGYPASPVSPPPMSPMSPAIDEESIYTGSDETHSAAPITPANSEMLGELVIGKPVPRRRSTGTRRSSGGLAPSAPMPSPTTPLPPLPSITVNAAGGRSSLPVPLPAMPQHAPPVPPLAHDIKSRVAFMPIKSLRANPAPVMTSGSAVQVPVPTVGTSPPSSSAASPIRRTTTLSASSSQDRLTVPEQPAGHVGNAYLRAPNRRIYNASVVARSMGHLPVATNAREASFYDDSDVDRVDPFLAHLGGQDADQSFVSLMLPWIDAGQTPSALSSVSNISIPSFDDSKPDLVAT
ncbi:hypothetical protein M408DRAFT_161301 [Serendipita vermifera MAFF 305830]|uniref:Uncharacterized protein n=1 Tax=Serendipita vermifera MAFF 305830 TaxID=933852 RepID=A0A0C3ATM3_SERVB|nr:hypothetical protein M408DRAFT_161301 [Serendipita vermifera MAFF 305830]